MRAMFGKEARELRIWFALAFSAVSIAMGYAYWGIWSVYEPGTSFDLDQISNFGSLLFFLAPAVGLLIGFVQIIPERRRERWAFLMHRPVTRTTLYLGKVAAGLVFYFAATALPFWLTIWWLAVNTQGDLGISISAFAATGIKAIATGTLFYFAAILTAIRPVRVYASRTLPIWGVFLLSIVIDSSAPLRIDVIAAILLSGLYGFAAWGCFLTGGHYRRQPQSARIALGFSLHLGILFLGMFLYSCYYIRLQDFDSVTTSTNKNAFSVESVPAALSLPLVVLPLALIEGPNGEDVRHIVPNFESYLHKDRTAGALWIGVSLFGIVLSIICTVLIGRRCAFPRKIIVAWSLGAIPLGPSAVLLLLSLQDWPVREICPSCTKQRVVTRELCEHCGAQFLPLAPALSDLPISIPTLDAEATT